MLRVVQLADQWHGIEAGLPERWADVRLLLTVHDAAQADRAAALLGPVAPGRRQRQIRFSCARRGAGPRPDALRRLLRRLDEAGIAGTLELVSATEAAPSEALRRATLAESWQAALAGLPPDWSDLYGELELASSDYLEPAAVLLSPLNPARHGVRIGFRFRCARRSGYGASPEMVRRCLERLDAESIRGQLRILRVLSETHNVATQGPVWYVGGKAV